MPGSAQDPSIGGFYGQNVRSLGFWTGRRRRARTQLIYQKRLGGHYLVSSPRAEAKEGNKWVNYFHIAIPTPVLVEDKRATLTSVHYLFDARDTARLTEVHVYDGPTHIKEKIFGWDGGQQGNHSGGLDASNGIPVNRDGISWGITITLKFMAEVGQIPNTHNSIVYFPAFGADFHHNI